MNEEILYAMSKNSRWSPSDLDTAFNYLNSLDLVLAAINVADKMNLSIKQVCQIMDS